MKALILEAHAKINRYLWVGQARKDGYHPIETIFEEISLHDKLIFTPRSKGIELKAYGKKIPGLKKHNLVLKALSRLKSELNEPSGIKVELFKNIPMGAGLGGGSTDCAAALIAGWHIWKKMPVKTIKKNPPDLLKKIAKEMGADVPFFLSGGWAKAKGTGEKLTVLKPTKKKWLIIVTPNVAVSTKAAYGWIDKLKTTQTQIRKQKKGNSFEAAIFPRYSKIVEAKNDMESRGIKEVFLSGSGASLFGYVQGKKSGEQIARRLKSRYKNVTLCQTPVSKVGS